MTMMIIAFLGIAILVGVALELMRGRLIGARTQVADTKRQWRHRARETRAFADHATDPGNKRTLLAIADAYDRLAKLAGKRKCTMEGSD